MVDKLTYPATSGGQLRTAEAILPGTPGSAANFDTGSM